MQRQDRAEGPPVCCLRRFPCLDAFACLYINGMSCFLIRTYEACDHRNSCLNACCAGPSTPLSGSPINDSSPHFQQAWGRLHPDLAQDKAQRLHQRRQPANVRLHTLAGDPGLVPQPSTGPTTSRGMPSPQSAIQEQGARERLSVLPQGFYSKKHGCWQTLGTTEQAMGSVGQVPGFTGQAWACGQQAAAMPAQSTAAPAVERRAHGAMASPHQHASSAAALKQAPLPFSNQSNNGVPANQHSDAGSMQHCFSSSQQDSSVHQSSLPSHREQQQGGAYLGQPVNQPMQRPWLQNGYIVQAQTQQRLQQASGTNTPLHAQAQAQAKLGARLLIPDSQCDQAQRGAGQMPAAAHMPAGAPQTQQAQAKVAQLLQLQQLLAQHNKQVRAMSCTLHQGSLLLNDRTRSSVSLHVTKGIYVHVNSPSR